MGLFNHYDSAGPGISKYAPKKKGLALFFDIFFRKIWLITGLNLLYSIFFLPFVLGFCVLNYVENYTVALTLLGNLLIVFTVTIGPATAGMTKVMRAFIIEKHTYVVRDFFRGFKENFKKGAIIGALDVLVAISAFAAYNIYPDLAEFYKMKILYAALVVTMSVFLVIILMNFYIYLMLVATDLSLKNLIKNSFALAFVSLKQNIITIICIAAFGFFMLVLASTALPVAIMVLPFFPAALVWFIVCFNSYPVIQRFVIDPYYTSIGEINPEHMDGSEDIEEETIFEDMGGKEKPIEKRKKGKGKRIS